MSIRQVMFRAFVTLVLLLCTATAYAEPLSPQEFKARLQGPVLSVPTPFNSDYSIDYPGIENVIKRALDYDCKVVALTSAHGQFDRLSFDEVKKVTWTTVQTAHPRAICIAAAGPWDIDTVLAYARYAQEIGADGLQVIRPKGFTDETDIAATVEFYRRLSQATALGIVLDGNFSPASLRELLKIDAIVALKEDGDLSYYLQRQVEFGQRLAVLGGGHEARYLHGSPYGSPAYYSTLYSYAPQIGREFWQAMQSRDFLAATRIVEKYDLPFMQQFSHPLWLAFIRYSGVDINCYLRPLPDDTQKTADQFKHLYQSMELTCPRPNFWTVIEGPRLPQPRGGHVAGLVGGKLVIAGGCNWSSDKTQKLWFDDCLIRQDSLWTAGPQLPGPWSYSAYASDDGGLLVAGGTDGQNRSAHVYILRDILGPWQPLPDLPQPVSAAAGALCGQKFYVAGGDFGDQRSDQMFVLDLLAPDQWRQAPKFPGPARVFSALVACHGKLYLLGGLADPFVPLNDAYCYDPASDLWEKLSDLPIKGYGWNARPISDDRLLLTGRADDSDPKIYRGIWEVQLPEMTCRRVAETLVPTVTAPLVEMAPAQWWLIGGEPDSLLNRTAVISVIQSR